MDYIIVNSVRYILSRKDILPKIDNELLKKQIDLIVNENQNNFYFNEIEKKQIDKDYYLVLNGFDSDTGRDICMKLLKL